MHAKFKKIENMVFLKRDEEEKEDYNAVKKRREIKQKKEKNIKKRWGSLQKGE